MFEVRPTDDLIRILAAGGGFEISAGVRPTEDLIRLASAASSKGARLTLRGLTVRPTDDLIRIAAAGKGSVVFAD
jgi:hypothetical protein